MTLCETEEELSRRPATAFTILEVNGAVDFTHEYRPGGDIFRETAVELARAARDAAADTRPASEDPVLI